MLEGNRDQGGSALVAEPSRDGEGGKQAPRDGDHNENQGTDALSSAAGRSVAPNESAVSEPQTYSEQPDPYQLRDLEAQESMAVWAMWMFVAAVFTFAITSIGTFLIWRQVKLTREALEDTGNATKAMFRQIELTEQAQRPWLGISATPRMLKRTGNRLSVEIDIETSNLGKTPALNYQLRFKFAWLEHGEYDFVEQSLAAFDPGDKPSRKSVIPGETEIFRYWDHKAVSHMKWGKSIIDHSEQVFGMFVVSAFYKSAMTDEGWLRTDKAWIIGWRKDGEVQTSVKTALRSVKPENLILEPVLAATLAD